MVDAPKVQPALTPEMWEVAAQMTRFEAEWWKFSDPSASYVGFGDARGASWTLRPGTPPDEGPVRHAAAALALHGQRFGFTREDVWALDVALSQWEAPSEVGANGLVKSIRDRIEALLPPEP